jgi:hypothetical protein
VDRTESKALVPLTRSRAIEYGSRSLAVRGARVLVALAGNPVVRRAAVTGVAFGVGFQLSRTLRAGRLPELVGAARDIYRVANGDDVTAEGRLAGRWVRESITVIASVYGYAKQDDR